MVFASARTQVDKTARTVVYENIKISKLDFPTLPDAPGHFRTLTNKGAITLARELGITRLGRAAFGVSPMGAASAAVGTSNTRTAARLATTRATTRQDEPGARKPLDIG